MDEIMEKQSEEMTTVLESLSATSPDTEEYTRIVNNYKTLADVEVKRREMCVKERESQSKLDSEKEEKKTGKAREALNTYWPPIRDICQYVLVPIGLAILGNKYYSFNLVRTMNFEKTGNIMTSMATKNLVNKMPNPYKKL
jgi:hypothetical protein